MAKYNQEFLDKLLKSEDKELNKLHQIVEDSLIEEESIVQSLSKPIEESRTFGEKVSDKIAVFGGSWRFIFIFMLLLAAWILLNGFMLAKKPFDPYPFILLNLILSFIAALQAPIIMMSQNRKEAKDRKRAENDYLINLKAEIEVRNLHKKVDLLIEEQLIRLFEIQKVQMEMLEDLKAKMDSKN